MKHHNFKSEAPNDDPSEIVILFNSWNRVQRTLHALNDNHPFFEVLFTIEEHISEKIFGITPRCEIDEDIQLMVLATNDMIEIDAVRYSKVSQRLEAVLQSSSNLPLFSESTVNWTEVVSKISMPAIQ